jgi:asparagine synthase (glutamine-hydrolysing)
MSGLCGVVRFDHEPIPPDTLKRMTQAAPHRGPATTHTHHHAHLAHHTHHPHDPPQPLTHHHLTLIASARIDNHDDLLPHLQPHLTTPHPTDAQLILAAHHHWGHDAPHHLIGDYAYALYDHHHHTLLAARDPMGMRPLYYHHTPHRTAIASEINQLLQLPDVSAKLFEPMVAAHLAGPFGRDEWTFYEGIHRLRPGHVLLVTAAGARSWAFWQPDPERRERYPREEDYAERFRELFLRSVHDRLRPPGTHGLMLSSGVDSGSIAAAAGWLWQQRTVDRPIRTYSWAFEELADADERSVSRQITDRFGLPAVAVPGDDAWPLAGYPAHGPERDDPFLAVYQPLMDRSFAAAASDGLRSLMSGDRGDPLMGDSVFDHLEPILRGRWPLAWRELAAHARLAGTSRARIARRWLVRPALEAVGLRPRARLDPRRALPEYVRPDWAARTGLLDTIAADTSPPQVRGHARSARLARVLRFRGLLDPVPQERRRARFGLEFADPWADRRVTEFVLAVPPWRVQRPSEPKRLARRALHGILPRDVAASLGKVEPVALFERGFRERARDIVLDLATNTRMAELGFVDPVAYRTAVEAFVAGDWPRLDPWWPLTLEIWLRAHHP